ncbi:unnamed protein product [Pleuronectes platessa]|uniref:Uncharacterized protein n=1 Tax=Pleuronectes platessa TaxID=8262 RepID=A0A9N7Z7C0_PLEPL|nr:unnamed protein product [Pleuronectes platessa]
MEGSIILGRDPPIKKNILEISLYATEPQQILSITKAPGKGLEKVTAATRDTGSIKVTGQDLSSIRTLRQQVLTEGANERPSPPQQERESESEGDTEGAERDSVYCLWEVNDGAA